MVLDARSEGAAEPRTGKVDAAEVRGAPYPHFDIPDEAGDERNEDIVPPPSEGARLGSLAPTADPTRLGDLSGGGAGEGVEFYTDTPFGDVVAFSGIPPDMSGASSENMVLVSGNTFAALSTDGGATFVALDPSTIFPSGPTTDACRHPAQRQSVLRSSDPVCPGVRSLHLADAVQQHRPGPAARHQQVADRRRPPGRHEKLRRHRLDLLGFLLR